MRVAITAEQLMHPSPGGIGRYTAQLLRWLPEECPGTEIVPVTARHPRPLVGGVLAGAGADAATVGRAAVQPLPAGLLYECWVTLGRPALRGLGDPDVVHAPSVAVPPASGRPLVVTVHDAAPLLFPDGFSARARRFHRRGLSVAARHADAVITVSSSAAEDLAARAGIGADRITVVPNGVDPGPADPAADAALERRLELGGRPVVLWVGTLEPRKAVGTLVAAMADLRRRGTHDGVVTVLAGYDGWLQRGLVDDADRRALGDSLRQVGRVGDPELWALYRRADVFAFPSRYEGFGLPVLEAMSQGVAAVVSDIPALREVAGPAALYVASRRPRDWADAVGGLLDDGTARSGLGRAGRARSLGLTARATAAATGRVYQAVGS